MQSLAHVSDEELVAQLTSCAFDIRRNAVRCLVILGEIEERKIHLAAAASWIFDYCKRFLLMSHGRSYRFMKGAQLCKKYPFLLERIARGEVHLSTLVYIASFITPANVEELVAETVGKDRSQVDLVLRRRFGVEPQVGRYGGNPLPYDDELLALQKRARELLSHEIPNGDALEIAKIAYRLLIDQLERKKRGKTERPRPAPTTPTKSIPRHATREMFERDGD